MTTNAQIRTAWNTYIWQNATIQAITDRIYDYDITVESAKEAAKLRYNQKINFFLYLVMRQSRPMIMGQHEQTFTVQVRYFKEMNVGGSHWNDVVDAFSTIDDLVISALTSTWNNTVDYYRTQDSPPALSLVTIEETSVWQGIFEYRGVKLIG